MVSEVGRTTNGSVTVHTVDLNEKILWPWIGNFKERISHEAPSVEENKAIGSGFPMLLNGMAVENEGLKLKPNMFVRGKVTSRVDGKGKVVDEDLEGLRFGDFGVLQFRRGGAGGEEGEDFVLGKTTV